LLHFLLSPVKENDILPIAVEKQPSMDWIVDRLSRHPVFPARVELGRIMTGESLGHYKILHQISSHAPAMPMSGSRAPTPTAS